MPRTPAGRLEFLHDLYAPHDEDGVRQPGAGIITLDQFRELLDAPCAPGSELENKWPKGPPDVLIPIPTDPKTLIVVHPDDPPLPDGEL